MSDYYETYDEKPEKISDHPSEKLSPMGISAMQGNRDDGNLASQLQTEEMDQNRLEEPNEAIDYSRPGDFRNGIRDQVWDNAQDKRGNVYDPLTGTKINEDQSWDMGHKPGYEFKKLQDHATEEGLSRKKFLDIYNDPSFYQPELPRSNRSHKGELGPGIDNWRENKVLKNENN